MGVSRCPFIQTGVFLPTFLPWIIERIQKDLMGKKKILIIDDEKNFCWMVKKRLEKSSAHRYKVHVETKGARALQTAKAVQPDLILLDVLMPDLAGPEVFEKLRNDAHLKHIPSVFLSGAIGKERRGGIFIGLVDGWPIKAHAVLDKLEIKKHLIAYIEKNLMKRELFDLKYDRKKERKPQCQKCNEEIELVNDAYIGFANEADVADLIKRYNRGDQTVFEETHLVHFACDLAERQRSLQ